MKLHTLLESETKPRGGDYVKSDRGYQRIDSFRRTYAYLDNNRPMRDVTHVSDLTLSKERYKGKRVWVERPG